MRELIERLHQADMRLAQAQALREAKQARLTDLEAEIANLLTEQDLLIKVDQVLLAVSSKVLGQSTGTIDKLVTAGLRIVFEDQKLEFKTEIEKYRGKTAVKFSLFENGQTAPLLDSYGGGVLVVASVLLRVVTIMVLGLRRLLLLDESLSHLSDQYIPNCSGLLRKLCVDLGFDVVLITHQAEFAIHADRHYRAVREEGAPTFRLMKTEGTP